jgi:hypothetical protein
MYFFVRVHNVFPPFPLKWPTLRKWYFLVRVYHVMKGGRIADSTVVCCCLSWDDGMDLDLHCTLLNGDECHYNNRIRYA